MTAEILYFDPWAVPRDTRYTYEIDERPAPAMLALRWAEQMILAGEYGLAAAAIWGMTWVTRPEGMAFWWNTYSALRRAQARQEAARAVALLG